MLNKKNTNVTVVKYYQILRKKELTKSINARIKREPSL